MCLSGHFGVDYRFNETFDGVVLAYDVQIQDKVAKILPGLHPYFCVRLKAKLLLFSPKPNMLLGSFSITVLIIHQIVYFLPFLFLIFSFLLFIFILTVMYDTLRFHDHVLYV